MGGACSMHGPMKHACVILAGYVKGREDLGELDVDEKITLKLLFNK